MVLRMTFRPVFVDDGSERRMSNPVPLSPTVTLQHASSFVTFMYSRLAPLRPFSPCFMEFYTRICMNIDGTMTLSSTLSSGALTVKSSSGHTLLRSTQM